MLVFRGIVAGVIVIGVSALAERYPRWGAFLLSLPIVSILAFLAAWHRGQDPAAISLLARETLVLVPLSLVFFAPLAFADRLGLGFWAAFGLGVLLASTAVGLWMWFGPVKL